MKSRVEACAGWNWKGVGRAVLEACICVDGLKDK